MWRFTKFKSVKKLSRALIDDAAVDARAQEINRVPCLASRTQQKSF
jgi:hypothetical protein